MRLALGIATLLLAAGCVEGLEPAELGIGRFVGVHPGDVAAVLPPMTDRAGNLYVATGRPDTTGAPQPGIALVGGARGGWSAGCDTGEGPRGGARGWIGATDGRGWLWTGTAILELDAASGACTTRLDRDPVSASDIIVLAAAPLIDETVSGVFAVAVISTGATPTPHLVTIDLELGVIRQSTPLPGVEVLGAGADLGSGQAAFLVRNDGVPMVLFAVPHVGLVATTPVEGAPGELAGELRFGADGSIAAVAGTTVLTGTRAGLRPATVTEPAIAIERDDDGGLWLVTDAGGAPHVAPIRQGAVGEAMPWTCAEAIDAALEAGVIVIDERGGERNASRWLAHSALGRTALVAPRSAPPYAVGARAWLVADPPVDRGGIPYSQLAVVPIGVSFP